jgi:hypothetical protein
LIEGGGIALSVQVLQEFHAQATKAHRPWAIVPETAQAMVAA